MSPETRKRPEEELHGERLPRPRFGPGSDDTKPAEDPADPRSTYDPQSSPKHDPSDPRNDKVASRDALKGAEQAANKGPGSAGKSDSDNVPYRPEDKLPLRAAGFGGLIGRGLGVIRRNPKKSAGGLIGGGVVGGMIFMGSIAQGPLQLVHLSQILQKNFFAQEDASETRSRALYRWARSGNVGETRLGELGSRQFKKIENHMKTRGITINTNGLSGHATSLTIDVGNNPDYRGLGNQEARSKIAADNGLDSSRVSQAPDGKVVANLDGMSISEQRAFLKSIHNGAYKDYKLLGSKTFGKVHTAIKFRTVAKYYNVPSWLHPLKKADAALNKKAANYAESKKRERDRKKGKTEKSPEAKARAAAIKKRLGVGAGIAGGGLLAQGAVCVVKDVTAQIPDLNRENVVIPAMASAGDAISLGAQVQSGDDFDIGQLGPVVDDFEDDNGKSIWSSKALDATSDPKNPGGEDIDPEIKQAFSGDSNAAEIESEIDKYGGDAICSGAGQIVGAAVGVAAIATGAGGVLSFIGGAAISAAVLPQIVDFVARLAADEPLTGVAHNGPDGGNIDAYGARELANTSFRASGGVPLSKTETAYFDNKQRVEEKEDFSSKSFFARMFDLYDHRSLLASAVGRSSFNFTTPASNVSGGFNSFIGSFSNIFSSIAPSVSAAEEPYDWGFSRYGISPDVLDDAAFADPYANADEVADIFDGNEEHPYIKRAKKCFGVSISNESGKWSVAAEEDVNPQSSEYIDANCDDTSKEWKRIILFVFDTRLMTSMECYDGDEETCAEIGVSNEASSVSASVGGVSHSLGGSPDDYTEVLELPKDAIGPSEIGYFNQCTDSRWANKEYPYASGGSNSVCASGCGPASLAMIVSTVSGKFIDPYDMGQKVKQHHVSDGTAMSGAINIVKEYGLSPKKISAVSDIKSVLRSGGFVVFNANAASPFTQAGHFVVIRAISEDGTKFWVADPTDNNGNGTNRNSTPWPTSSISGWLGPDGLWAVKK